MTLVDMRPVLTADYVLDGWHGHPEVSGDLAIFQPFASHRANTTNIIRRQAGSTIALTNTRAGSSGRMSITGHRVSASLTNHVGNVVGLRTKEQVIGPDTGAVVAAVQDAHSHRDRTIGQYPCNSVGALDGPRVRKANHPVAGARSMGGPLPTVTTSIDLGPKPISNGTGNTGLPRVNAFGHGRLL